MKNLNVLVWLVLGSSAVACGGSDRQGFLVDTSGSSTASGGDSGGSGSDAGSGAGNGGSTAGNGGGNNGGNAGNGGSGGADAGGPAPDSPPGVLATGIAVTEVAVFQAVKIDVVANGTKVGTRNAPVVANRDALVRAYVKPGSGYSAKSLTAELRIASATTTFPTVRDTKTISGASTDADMNSTFDFQVPASSLTTDAQFSVAITDPSQTSGATDGTTARYPTTGADALNAKSTGPQLKVLLVPVKYTADGSNRLPATDAAQVKAYTDAMYGYYPAAKVEVTVRAPWSWNQTIDASGNGFDTILQALSDLRNQDNAPDDVYYFAAFEPSSSFNSYCGNGCVTGLSGVATDPSDASVRASVGIGYSGQDATITMAHEVGHAHGREHAPCGGAASPDPKFPYSNGGIGVWGYDLNTKTLIAPSTGTDLMGYCDNVWISDFNYSALFTRMAEVNGMPTSAYFMARPYRFISVHGDGSLAWGIPTSVRKLPNVREHTATFVSANGEALSTEQVHFVAYDHLPGGYMLVPEPPVGTAKVVLSGPRVSATLAR